MERGVEHVADVAGETHSRSIRWRRRMLPMSYLTWGTTNVLQRLSSIFVYTNDNEILGCGG